MISMKTLGSREEWLQERGKRIGGSECAAIIGQNPFTDNVALWELKTGRHFGADAASDNPLVIYGSKAEKYLRELFILDHPQYVVGYAENNLWTNDLYPFAHASLDGWLYDGDRFGILEIKTATIASGVQKTKWDEKIPNNYFCQVLWYMAITDAEFAIVAAQLKWENQKDIFKITRYYNIERKDVETDIDYLMEKGKEFYSYIESDKRPPLILPSI